MFCEHLLRLTKSAVLANTDISSKPKYRLIISARPIYRSISNDEVQNYVMCIILIMENKSEM